MPSGFRSWNELTTHGEEDWDRFNDLHACNDTTAARLFSSGTTGLPKAAMISHRNLIAQHKLVFETKPPPHQVSGHIFPIGRTVKTPEIKEVHVDFGSSG